MPGWSVAPLQTVHVMCHRRCSSSTLGRASWTQHLRSARRSCWSCAVSCPAALAAVGAGLLGTVLASCVLASAGLAPQLPCAVTALCCCRASAPGPLLLHGTCLNPANTPNPPPPHARPVGARAHLRPRRRAGRGNTAAGGMPWAGLSRCCTRPTTEQAVCRPVGWGLSWYCSWYCSWY